MATFIANQPTLSLSIKSWLLKLFMTTCAILSPLSRLETTPRNLNVCCADALSVSTRNKQINIVIKRIKQQDANLKIVFDRKCKKMLNGV